MAGQLPLHIGFNQDNGCFAVGEANGFRIFNTCPFNEQVRLKALLRRATAGVALAWSSGAS